MRVALREINQRKIETIFNLVEQFKECYLDQKSDGRRFEIKDEDDSQSASASNSPRLNHTITLSEFRPLEKTNVLINACRDADNQPATSTKEHSCGKENFSGEGED